MNLQTCILQGFKKGIVNRGTMAETEEDDNRKALTGFRNMKVADKILTREVSRENWRQTSDESVGKKKTHSRFSKLLGLSNELKTYVYQIYSNYILIAIHHYEIK